MNTKALVLIVPYAAVKKLLGSNWKDPDAKWEEQEARREKRERKRAAARRKAAREKLEELKKSATIHIKFIRGRWVMGGRRGWCVGYGSRRSSYYSRRRSGSKRTGPRCGNKPAWDRKYAETLVGVTCEACRALHAKDIDQARTKIKKEEEAAAKKLAITKARLEKKIEQSKAGLAAMESGVLKKSKVNR